MLTICQLPFLWFGEINLHFAVGELKELSHAASFVSGGVRFCFLTTSSFCGKMVGVSSSDCRVQTETICLAKPKIVSIWSLAEKDC